LKNYNPAKWKLCWKLLGISLFFVTLNACGSDPNPVRTRYPLLAGEQELQLEVVKTPVDRALGLMFRTNLEDHQGMLFVFQKDEQLAFWMKNTLLPLSIAYIAHDGTIREILDMKPQSLASVNSTYAVRYALELPQGAFDRLGIRIGNVLPIQQFLTEHGL